VARVAVSTVIDRAPAEVWADLRDIASHADWMGDARAIRFLSERTEGVGTRFECDTRIGPFRVTDVMEITAWDEAARMGVVHSGLVTGTGQFSLTPVPGGRTELRWEEELRFPWWLGGRLAQRLAAPVLAAVWRRNLGRLKRRLESR
jgi:uncharacterized protein YndB with AHSA1/START domain